MIKMEKLRKDLGVSLDELSSSLGLTVEHLKEIEMGKVLPTFSRAERIARALKFAGKSEDLFAMVKTGSTAKKKAKAAPKPEKKTVTKKKVAAKKKSKKSIDKDKG